jgi:hypothetical protein
MQLTNVHLETTSLRSEIHAVATHIFASTFAEISVTRGCGVAQNDRLSSSHSSPPLIVAMLFGRWWRCKGGGEGDKGPTAAGRWMISRDLRERVEVGIGEGGDEDLPLKHEARRRLHIKGQRENRDLGRSSNTYHYFPLHLPFRFIIPSLKKVRFEEMGLPWKHWKAGPIQVGGVSRHRYAHQKADLYANIIPSVRSVMHLLLPRPLLPSYETLYM